MEIQHVNVKVFARHPVQLTASIPVFHRWIRETVGEETLIDVADYDHVPNGPGVILIGHEANYSLDKSRGRVGLLYNRKARVSGGPQAAAIEQALRAALAACRTLEAEPEFAGELAFNAGEIELIVNDRLLAPNTPESFDGLKPALESALEAVYGNAVATGSWRIERAGEPRERLRIAACADRAIRVADLAAAEAACSAGGPHQ